jgi:hypothetical protein
METLLQVSLFPEDSNQSSLKVGNSFGPILFLSLEGLPLQADGLPVILQPSPLGNNLPNNAGRDVSTLRQGRQILHLHENTNCLNLGSIDVPHVVGESDLDQLRVLLPNQDRRA